MLLFFTFMCCSNSYAGPPKIAILKKGFISITVVFIPWALKKGIIF